MAFAKYHGLGNDFVIVDRRRRGLFSPIDARKLCDRHRGIGADGVLSILEPERGGDLRMHVYNSDGSVAEMCGNGLRCVVHRAAELFGRARFRVETDAGLRGGEVIRGNEVRVSLGRARVDPKPVSVTIGAARVEGRRVDLGNPHLVLPELAPELDLGALAAAHGAILSRHPDFESGTNVEFPRTLPDGSVEVVVFERGVGLTQACGTGAGAVVAAAAALGRPKTEVLVRLPGGPLRVYQDDDEIVISGEAVHVFDGVTELVSS